MATVPAPRDWVPGDALTASVLNSQIRDAMKFALNPPRARLRNSAAQSIANNSWVALTMNTEDADTDAGHSGTNPHYVCQTAGTYLVTAGVMFATVSTGAGLPTGQRGIRLTTSVNSGSAWASAGSVMTPSTYASGSAVGAIPLQVTRQVQLNVGDWVRAEAFQSTGAALATTVGVGDVSHLELLWVSS